MNRAEGPFCLWIVGRMLCLPLPLSKQGQWSEFGRVLPYWMRRSAQRSEMDVGRGIVPDVKQGAIVRVVSAVVETDNAATTDDIGHLVQPIMPVICPPPIDNSAKGVQLNIITHDPAAGSRQPKGKLAMKVVWPVLFE